MEYKSAVKSSISLGDPLFIVVDLFCGAGGTTTGFEESYYVGADGQLHKSVRVVACVNHDFKAIKSHWRNHKHVRHFNEDMRILDLDKLVRVIKYWRKRYPNAKLVLWASLECTNFSKAKGGLPRDADSRTLADHLHRYIKALNPDIIQIENVVEFMSWGPLDENGKPLSKKSGSDWMRWRKAVCAHGYVDEWREMNSADFGAYTSRNRLFGMFARTQADICWPEPTHTKNPSTGNLFGYGLEKWKACRPCLDLQDHGNSVFTPGKIKSDKTFERILAGCIRFIAGMGYKEFITKYFSGNAWHMNYCVDSPAATIRTVDGQAIVQAEFLSKNYSGRPEGKNISVEGPAGTITTFGGSHALVQSEFLLKYNSTDPRTGEHRNASVYNPAPVIPTQRIPNLVQADFLSHYYSNGGESSSLNEPAPTIPTKARAAKVKAEWLDKGYSNAYNHQSIDSPAGAITGSDKYALMHSDPFISNTNYDNVGQSIDQPLGTITANRKWHYLMNPQYHAQQGCGLDSPCFTLIASMDKRPPYLVNTESGPAIEVYEIDSEAVRKLKFFMAMYGISDIKMRMLKVVELKRIQGFPENYVLEGNQADQKKFIGNSVVPQVVKAWTQALGDNILKYAA